MFLLFQTLTFIPGPKNGVIVVQSGECYTDIRNVSFFIIAVRAGQCATLRCNFSNVDSDMELVIQIKSGNLN